MLLVITDLDGTLLDHHDYGFAPAQPVLAELDALGWPVVIDTSKTEAELEQLRPALGHGGPFVVENGSVLCVPEGAYAGRSRPRTPVAERTVLGAPYAGIRRALERLRAERGHRFVGFGDVDDAEVARWTGLTLAEAAAARRRAASEPLLFEGDAGAFERFTADVEAAGLTVTRGGRFVHVMGKTDKGRAVPALRRGYGDAHPGERITTVGLGDGANDVPLLEACEVAVVIPRPDGGALSLPDHRRALTASRPGPAGWAEAMGALIERERRGKERTDG